MFTIEVTNNASPPTYHQIFNLKVGEKKVVTSLRADDVYTVTETGVKYGGYEGTSGSLDDYNKTIEIYGIEQNTFIATQGSEDSEILVTNSEKALGQITVYKVFNPFTPGGAKTSLIELYKKMRSSPPTFEFTLTKPGGTVETFTLKAGESQVFNNLPYGEYIVTETNSAGFDVSYSDTDATNGNLTDGKVTLTILEKEDEVTVTNYPKSNDQTVDVVGKKVWQGGSTSDHVAVVMLLKRNGEIIPLNEQPAYTVSPASGTSNEFTYTWTGLQKYDAMGKPYVYTIDEQTVPNDYRKEISEDGLTVTNIFEQGLRHYIATKIWVNGPTPRPTIYFELFRTIDGINEEPAAYTGGALAEVMELPHGTYSVEWSNLPEEDINNNPYTYYVKEN